MTRLTKGPARPNLGALFHDLTEITGELVCGLPAWAMGLLPGTLSPRCSSCDTDTCDRCGSTPCACASASADPCWPCWMPTTLAGVHDRVCAGSFVRVTVCVENRSLREQEFFIAATGPDASLASGSPSSVAVDPLSSGTLEAVIKVPSTREGECIDLTLWVRGCHDYVVPVRLVADGDRCNGTHVRHVVEQTDTCHTWRDHFYVSRPCGHDRPNHPNRDRVVAAARG